jgi:signal transduction histidine kinase
VSVDFTAFDRELSLGELLKGMPLDRVVAALEMLSGKSIGIEDGDGRLIAGHAVKDGERIPFRLEIEALGQLVIEAGAVRPGAAAASLWQMLLQARAQVIRAAELHSAAMNSDYEELRVQNEALRASESRYRELAEELEARVKAQVALLDERQRQLYQAERLASVGQLAAGVAHEINNPLGFIRSNLDTARKYLDKFHALKASLPAGSATEAAWQRLDLDFVLDDFADLLADSIVGADRVTRIVKDLKGFSNVDRPEEQDVDLNAQIASVVAVLAGQKPASVSIVESYGELPKLLCLPGLLNQVFVNVLTNALQALENREQGGEVRVSTRLDDQAIVVAIADNGCGIDNDAKARVFEPFFTTRGVGRGTGLGLTVARDIVAAHGGTIDFDSRPGDGTTVSIRLPL